MHRERDAAFFHPTFVALCYSGMPMPMRAPINPPTGPATPNRARAPMMGPAVIKGPTPGIAMAPYQPTGRKFHRRLRRSSRPSRCLRALWYFFQGKFFELSASGSKTETSSLADPKGEDTNNRYLCLGEVFVWTENGRVLICYGSSSCLLFDRQLIGNLVSTASHRNRFRDHSALFITRFHRSF
jgi:hypothetical protein